jgi:hypothetical protein
MLPWPPVLILIFSLCVLKTPLFNHVKDFQSLIAQLMIIISHHLHKTMSWGKINRIKIQCDIKVLISIEMIVVFKPKLSYHIQYEIDTNEVASGILQYLHN